MKHLSFVLYAAFAVLIASSCDSNGETGRSNKPAIFSVDAGNYFPLKPGNNWTYKRSVSAGKTPLYSYIFTIENDDVGQYSKGTSILRSGKEPRLRSGEQTYVVLTKTNNGYEIRAEGNPASAHGFGPYRLRELDSLTWNIANWGDGTVIVWESKKGTSVGGTGTVGELLGMLTPGTIQDKLEDKKITSVLYDGLVTVPAGSFRHTIKNTIAFKGGVDSERLTIVRYFAKNVGLIKEVEFNENGDQIYVLELFEYSVN